MLYLHFEFSLIILESIPLSHLTQVENDGNQSQGQYIISTLTQMAAVDDDAPTVPLREDEPKLEDPVFKYTF